MRSFIFAVVLALLPVSGFCRLRGCCIVTVLRVTFVTPVTAAPTPTCEPFQSTGTLQAS
jgi:hypothetical protein